MVTTALGVVWFLGVKVGMHKSAIPHQGSRGSDKDHQKNNGIQNAGRKSRSRFTARSRELESAQKRITPDPVKSGSDKHKSQRSENSGYNPV